MKHASRIVMIALLYNGVVHPIPSLNFGKELIQKSTGWVTNTVPGWAYWAGLVVLCAVQWQRFHNKWRASEEKYATFERQVKAQAEQNKQNQSSSLSPLNQETTSNTTLPRSESEPEKICRLLKAQNLGDSLVAVDPITTLLIKEGMMFYPNFNELLLYPKRCQNLHVKYAVGQTEKSIMWVNENENMILVDGDFLQSLGNNPLIKIFDEKTKSILDNTVKFDVPQNIGGQK